MKAAVLHRPAPMETRPLAIEDLPVPEPGAGEALLRVEACGVCRTDLHITLGELKPLREWVTPGHQIVGRIERFGSAVPQDSLHIGQRVGVSWLGGVDGTCPLCRKGQENLCDHPVFTGYSVNGGYAEYATARADFLIPLPEEPSAESLAPLLCAGIIGFRSLRVAGVQPGDRVGLFGFGASAHLTIDVLKHWGCEVYVSSRGESHRALARERGAAWVGDATEKPPAALDCAVTFAPSGDVVLAALGSLRKGGIVAINAIHLDRIPQFDYDSLLWGERQMRSVANMTRQDAKDFVAIAQQIGIRPQTTRFRLDQVNDALDAVLRDAIDGAAVVLP
ncbi:zinc-dependent alcohol dehydrogenase family protein [Acidipila sp. 4G-K13]|uniref:Zinc-binding alcohol dehydrogenase family protein n=2 Tax=Paracidobacterium acidisoli TaxID=2303751 RepID=A0A372IV75_9BACT|nr:zinc-dependent alcohol dehydrogenase family protein [Paracidobacterium acidisoli]MBT9329598.1 zinc-dependent alcohol dehydrogenase family protein [Paracidobacterium acidisoli]